MYSQNCGYLPSKNQSPFACALPHSLGLLRNFTSKTIPKLEPSKTPIMQFENTYSENIPTENTGIMDFVSNLRVSSKSFKNSIPNIQLEKERTRNCKEIFDNCILNNNSFATMPIMPTHLVGGFVGSKSQLGRRPTHGFGVKMWDIIRELFVFAGKSDIHIESRDSETLSHKKYSCSYKIHDQSNCIDKKMNCNSSDKNSNTISNNVTKQSYAEVAKLKLPVTTLTKNSLNEKNTEHNKPFREESELPKSVIVSNSVCTLNRPKSPIRDRIASECSVDSEDSFIVFENCDGDYESYEEDSDDESVVSLKNVEDSPSDCFCPASFDFATSSQPAKKKVRFAEGERLVQVHPMVTWGYAYRSARRGPWEMLARDSERFRHRISTTEAILKPVLDTRHREAIFRQRFANHSW